MASAGDPTACLPSPIPDATINLLLEKLSLPLPKSISKPHTSAQYHTIYILEFDTDTLSAALKQAENKHLLHHSDVLPEKTSDRLILRVAGRHLPRIKTENEAAVITWLARNAPSVPVPPVIHYDSDTKNAIGHEYELMVCAEGVTLGDVYEELDEDEKRLVVAEMLRIVAELHKHEFKHIGGFKFDDKDPRKVVPGPVLEETFWQQPDVEEYWSNYPDATVASLNISGPYDGYVDYISAHFERCIFAIKTHEALLPFMQDILPRLEGFVKAINEPVNKKVLNQVKLGLAHKDLHFGNVMYDRDARKITAILDWEFSGVAPYPRADPARAFLWSGQMTEEAKEEQVETKQMFEEMAREKGLLSILEDAKYTSKLQEHMQLAQNYLRGIVEVVPRGVKEHNWESWKRAVSRSISAFE